MLRGRAVWWVDDGRGFDDDRARFLPVPQYAEDQRDRWRRSESHGGLACFQQRLISGAAVGVAGGSQR